MLGNSGLRNGRLSCDHSNLSISAVRNVWQGLDLLIGPLCESPPVRVEHFLLPGSVRQSPILEDITWLWTQMKLSNLTVFTGLTVYK